MPGILAGIQQNPEIKMEKKPNTIMDAAKFLMSTAWDNRASIATAAAQTLGPMLLAAKVENEEYAVKANYV